MAGINENSTEAPPNQPSVTRDHVRPPEPEPQRVPPSGTYFGLNRNQPYLWGLGATPRDYKARYPPDPYGQEMSDNARIWSIYLDEAADFDAHMLAEWRDTIDVLLVFAGLFSAVLTTFVVQTSQNMQPDYNEASANLLFEILKATTSNSSQSSIPSSLTAFFSSPDPYDEWTNSLWFVSLTFSLITALVAVLVKQWLHQYVAVISDSSARDRARIRHLRYAGLQTWQVPMIIGLLPVLLHTSLALFFVGLAVFLFSLEMKVAWLVSIIGAATYVAYVIALILPFIYPYCPYKVPLMLYIHRLYQSAISLIPHITLMRHHSYTLPLFQQFHRHYNPCSFISWTIPNIKLLCRERPPSLNKIKHDHVQKYAAKVDVQSLLWLHSSTSNASVHQSVLQACSGMTSVTLEWLPDEFQSAFKASLNQKIEQMETFVPSPDAERELELYYRAYTHFDPHFLSIPCNHDHIANHCSNEQLKMILYSMKSSKALAGLLGILQGPQHSSLILHSVVWQKLVGAALLLQPCPGSSILELEIELMKVLAISSAASESGDVTTIDKPTSEMRECILHQFLVFWEVDDVDHYQGLVATSSIGLDWRIVIALIHRMQQRLCNSVHASDRKQLIETFFTIIEHTSLTIERTNLIIGYECKDYEVNQVLNALYSLLSSGAFAIIEDLETQILACRIFMILAKHREITPSTQLYSVTFQCYLRSLADHDERPENDVMLPILKCLLTSSVGMSSSSPMHDISFHGTLTLFDLLPYQTTLFSTNAFFSVVLSLIDGHNESVLYKWAQHPFKDDIWEACFPQLVQWTLSERFYQWTFLKRVLAIVVIQELHSMLDYDKNKVSLPQYDYGAHKDVNFQPPWLHEISSSSSSREPNAVEYSQVAAHPKFQEFLHSHSMEQDNIYQKKTTKLYSIRSNNTRGDHVYNGITPN